VKPSAAGNVSRETQNSVPKLLAEGVTVHYRNRPAVDAVSFSINDPGLTVLLGPNGSGKSSLLRTLAGILIPTKGSITLNSKEIRHWRASDLCQILAYVPQDNPMTFDFTVGELVGLAAKGPDAVHNALAQMELTEFAERSVVTLSGGERQRAALARAIAQQTPLLLLDEPTAHLDLRHQILLLESLRAMTRRENRSILIVLHDLNLASAFADHILILQHGKLVADDCPNNVLTAERIRDIYHAPVAVEPDPSTGRPMIRYTTRAVEDSFEFSPKS
jgi:iron complex transport system ATP-binding protein